MRCARVAALRKKAIFYRAVSTRNLSVITHSYIDNNFEAAVFRHFATSWYY